nr:hypothetical protein [Tanacetum cinerariifolium]
MVLENNKNIDDTAPNKDDAAHVANEDDVAHVVVENYDPAPPDIILISSDDDEDYTNLIH